MFNVTGGRSFFSHFNFQHTESIYTRASLYCPFRKRISLNLIILDDKQNIETEPDMHSVTIHLYL